MKRPVKDELDAMQNSYHKALHQVRLNRIFANPVLSKAKFKPVTLTHDEELRLSVLLLS